MSIGRCILIKQALLPWYIPLGGEPEDVIAAYQPKGAESLADSYINIANPGTYDCTLGKAPTWNTTDGWIGSTTARPFLKTGITPTYGYSYLVRFTNATKGTRMLFGSASNGSTHLFQMGIIPYRTSSKVYYQASYSGGALDIAPQLPSGVLGIAGQRAYRNGVDDGAIPLVEGNIAVPMVILGYSASLTGASVVASTDAYIQAFAVWNKILSAEQMLYATNRINEL